MTTRTKDASPAGRPAMRLFCRAFLVLLPLLITGCETINVAQCTLPDNQANRVAARTIVASVAVKHGLVERADQVDQNALLASYDFPGDPPKRVLSLLVYADAGTITACLSQ